VVSILGRLGLLERLARARVGGVIPPLPLLLDLGVLGVLRLLRDKLLVLGLLERLARAR